MTPPQGTSEKVRIFDANMSPVPPFVVEKKEAHKKGYWHKNFNCWIVRREASADYVLFQLRSKDKTRWPLCFDISAGGHIPDGEEIEDGVRELKEEIGLDVSFSDLTFAGIFRNVMDIPDQGHFEREFAYTYYLSCPKPLSEYVYQTEETAGLYQVKIKDALAFFGGNMKTLKLYGADAADIREVPFSEWEKSFVPYFSRYYLRAMIMAERFLNGEKKLAI